MVDEVTDDDADFDMQKLLERARAMMPSPVPYVEGSGPRNAIVILLDSLNRSMLGCYGGTEFETPNLDRFAARSVQFTNHFSGSLPCMPARHDILCGALDFLWKPWGSIEIWEEAITQELRMTGVVSQLISDHPHLFEIGGENYHCEFSAWDYQRGHEGDPWKTRPDPSWVGTPALPAATGWVRRAYDDSRTYFREEADFPGPKTMAATARWIDDNCTGDGGRAHDRFFLFVDEFDPHEPFDTPEPWTFKYHDQRDGDLLIWPPYAVNAYDNPMFDERMGAQVRANYGAKLSMIDHWFGKVLDRLDAHDLWKDTAVIVCTDHGHYLGEYGGRFGKPPSEIRNVLGHTPLMVAWPGVEPTASNALTTNVDINATIADIFDVTPGHRTHGRSMRPVIEGHEHDIREYVLQGYFGREVNIIDEDGKYIRTAPEGTGPISIWSNRWSTMQFHAMPRMRLDPPDERAYLDTMPGTDVPCIRQPLDEGRGGPFGAMKLPTEHRLYDLDDEGEVDDIHGSHVREDHYVELLRHAFDELEAPDDQYARLGLT
jgi:arylsulfatase A-like enzyme